MASSPPLGELFDRLFQEHFTYVWNALRRLGVREADREDLVQEVFVRVHKALPTYDDGRPPRPWLFAFAFRVASDHRRLHRNNYEILATPPEMPSAEAEPEAALDDVQRRARLHRALDLLDLDKRAVLVMHELEELPIPEIARALGIPEGTAYSRLRAARMELKRALEVGGTTMEGDR